MEQKWNIDQDSDDSSEFPVRESKRKGAALKKLTLMVQKWNIDQDSDDSSELSTRESKREHPSTAIFTRLRIVFKYEVK
ncbi:hypothetical protein P3L10_018319 [Capsicum annuum]